MIVEYDGFKFDTAQLTEDDMPNEVFQEVFTFCGADVAISLLKHFCGSRIQVPTRGLSAVIKKLIVKEYNGTTASMRAISRKYKISDRYIRNVLEEARLNPAPENQIALDLKYK